MATTGSQGTSSATTAMDDEAPPDMLFTNVAAVFGRLAELDGDDDALIVGRVSPSDFRALETERDRRGQHCRLFYRPETESIIITLPTLSHSEMHIILFLEIQNTMVSMGAHDDWRPIGDTTHNASNGSSGQGDSAGSPFSGRDGDDWPTLVIEAGVSQTLPSLRAKMRWWFTASSHRVNVVILVKMHRAQETVQIDKWVEGAGRPGATATRWATHDGQAMLQPNCQQSIGIAWAGPEPILQTPNQSRTASLFRVTGGPLVIGFTEIFLRAPTAGEHDIVISNGRLQHVVSRIWQDL